MMKQNCPFCEIAAGKAEAQIVYQDEMVTAFQDNRPMAPVHILLIPNDHIESINDVQPEHEAMLGRMIAVSGKLSKEMNLEHRGYRLVINTGPDARQTIFHLHMHLIGGRDLPFRFE
jgi:histidine triad (HIT) family protein